MFFGCRLMWSSNHLYTTLCNHQNQQQLLRPGSRSLDVIDLGDKGSGVSLFTLYCTVLCIHSINIMLQPSLLLAGRRKEWPCFLSLSSTWFKSNFFAHSVLSCMISHNQLVFSASPSYVRKVNICPTHLSNVDRSGGVGLGGVSVCFLQSEWSLSAHAAQYLTWFCVKWVTVPGSTTAQVYNMSLWKWEFAELLKQHKFTKNQRKKQETPMH